MRSRSLSTLNSRTRTRVASSCMEAIDDTDALLGPHIVAWEHLWARFRLDLSGDGVAARTLRLHLIQTLSPNTADLDAGILPAA